MRAFEIYVNGEKVCTAGTPGGATSVGVGQQPDCDEAFAFAIGGFATGADPHGWRIPPLHIGDELSIRYVEVESADAAEAYPSGENLPQGLSP